MQLRHERYTSFSIRNRRKNKRYCDKVMLIVPKIKKIKKLEKKCLTPDKECVIIIKHCFGELPEWFKGLVLKTSDSERDRGFESHILR